MIRALGIIALRIVSTGNMIFALIAGHYGDYTQGAYFIGWAMFSAYGADQLRKGEGP